MNLATIGWPSGTDTGWPSEPRNMLPGRVEGFPAGVQASANTAEQLLTQAVAYWDASKFRDGDRFLRNRGVAGDLLDLRLGSSITPNTNDPLWLGVQSRGYVYLPGGLTLNSLSVADPFNNTGDLDISLHLNGNIDANNTRFIDGGGVIIHWNGGILTFVVRDASGTQNISSTVSASAYRDVPTWFRVAYTDSTRTAVFYAASGPADTYPTSWTTLYTGSHAGGARVATTGTAHIGNRADGLRGLRAYVNRVLVSNAGTTVLDIDCDTITSGSATSFTALTGQTVTINRSTSGRKSVAVPSRGNRGGAVFLFGTDDYMQVVDNWQHQLLNFGQGDSFTVLVVARPTTANRPIIYKASAFQTGPAWQLGTLSSIISRLWIGDGSNGANVQTAFTLNSAQVFTGVRSGSSILSAVNATTTAAAASSAIGSLRNVLPVRIGTQSASPTTYADMELYAAAIFRRALTPAEIKTISDYFTARIA